MKVISQLDYGHIKFPNTPYSWATYGCLATCICMLLDKTPEEFVAENPTGWTSDGNLRTDAVLAKYGYKLVREPLVEGQKLPLKPFRTILRTSFFNPRFPTHFLIQEANSTNIIDPASRYNPKTENRYANKVNEMRYLIKISEPTITVQKQSKTLEQRVQNIEDKLGIT